MKTNKENVLVNFLRLFVYFITLIFIYSWKKSSSFRLNICKIMKNFYFFDFFSIQTDKSIHSRLCFFSSIFRPSSHYYIAIRWYFRTITNSIKSDIYFTTYQEMILRFKMLLLADLMIEIERVYRNVQSCGLHCFSPFCRDQIFNYSPPRFKTSWIF